MLAGALAALKYVRRAYIMHAFWRLSAATAACAARITGRPLVLMLLGSGVHSALAIVNTMALRAASAVVCCTHENGWHLDKSTCEAPFFGIEKIPDFTRMEEVGDLEADLKDWCEAAVTDVGASSGSYSQKDYVELRDIGVAGEPGGGHRGSAG